MEVIQKVFANDLILQQIFEMFNFKEQLQLISVCKQFEFVIENFIWKRKFNEIQVLHAEEGYYIKFNQASENEFLTESECQNFFAIIAKHVQNLIIISRIKEKVIDFYNFENLKFLEFNYSNVTQNNLESVVKNCPKLETIYFLYCLNFNKSMFDLKRRGQIDTLAKMKNLKNLKLAGNFIFDLKQLNDLLNQCCLKSLNLETYFYKDELEAETQLKNSHELQHLNINCCNEIEAWLQIEENYLKKFTNLQTLTLDGADSIFRDSNLLALADSSPNLQDLTLTNWKILIVEFPQHLCLKKLTLNDCKQLTWKNLQEFLNITNLEEFVSDETIYQGKSDIFKRSCSIANTLKVVDIKTTQNKIFLKFFHHIQNKLENLKIFRYELLQKDPFKILTNFLTLCINLQELCIQRVALPIDDLMVLKQLKILKFHIFPSMNLSFLATLLRHCSLENISIEMLGVMEKYIYDEKSKTKSNKDFDLMILKEDYDNLTLNTNVFASNLSTLKIPFIIFHKHQNLFLDLLNMKKDLKLTLFCYTNFEGMLNQHFLNELINNEKFPSHIKFIKILKKYYACSDLKDNFRTTVDDVSQNDGCLTVTL